MNKSNLFIINQQSQRLVMIDQYNAAYVCNVFYLLSVF